MPTPSELSSYDPATDLKGVVTAEEVWNEIGMTSPDSVTVGKYRTMLKAACSYAVVIGELSQSKADTMLQTAYGNDTETTVSASEISSLTDQWV
jgi:hypothetical protein